MFIDAVTVPIVGCSGCGIKEDMAPEYEWDWASGRENGRAVLVVVLLKLIVLVGDGGNAASFCWPAGNEIDDALCSGTGDRVGAAAWDADLTAAFEPRPMPRDS